MVKKSQSKKRDTEPMLALREGLKVNIERVCVRMVTKKKKQSGTCIYMFRIIWNFGFNGKNPQKLISYKHSVRPPNNWPSGFFEYFKILPSRSPESKLLPSKSLLIKFYISSMTLKVKGREINMRLK